MSAANSNHPCLWCTVKNEEFSTIGHGCSITNTKLHARSILEALKINVETEKDRHPLLTLKSIVEASKSYSHPPLTNINFQNAVVDILQMFLRITDRLELLLFNRLFKLGIYF